MTIAIKICKLQGLKKAELQSITQFTLNAVRKNHCFDTIPMLGNNFDLFETLRRARWLVK
jgi:hypothetical protein